MPSIKKLMDQHPPHRHNHIGAPQHGASAASLPIALTEAQGPAQPWLQGEKKGRRKVDSKSNLHSLKLTFLASSGSSNSRPAFHTVPQTPTSTGHALFIDASLPFSRELGSGSRERRPNLEISVGAGAATAAAAPRGRDVESKGGGASLLRGRDVARGGGESARGGAAGRDLLNAGIVRWPRSLGTEATAHAPRRRWAGSRAPVTNRVQACGGCGGCDGDVSGPRAGWC